MNRSLIKSQSRELIRINAPKIFIISIAYIIVSTIMAELEFRLPGTRALLDEYVELINNGNLPNFGFFRNHFNPIGAALATLIALATPVVSVGFISYCLKISRALPADAYSLLDGFILFLKIIFLTILMGIFIFLWSLLLFFPGFIAAYRYRQAFYILLDNPNKSVLQCIADSKALMRGFKLDLFLLDLSFIGWFILDGIISYFVPFPFPIMSVWISPYTGISYAQFYNNLIGRNNENLETLL